ncbi:tetratricopeptide repeat protein [Shewanella aestuarii]|uniref:Tetratricopeptide repeat protein n=1 Tax=Shewanella aestuarii TaxID=1028752 RepID=A0A6G9QGR6_9GAMM|nr:tetratricopeptide repeat protein [Shewanella aestuarii]QIR13363.1 tetratricopeptide repeat protein [Shewanella aestuarii]
MSVINKMLQDLEKRQQSDSADNKVEPASFVRPELQFTTKAKPPTKSRLPWVLAALVVLMVWLGYSLFEQAQNIQPVSKVTTVKQPTVDETNIDPVKADAPNANSQTNQSQTIANTSVETTVLVDGAVNEVQVTDKQVSDEQLTDIALADAPSPVKAPAIASAESVSLASTRQDHPEQTLEKVVSSESIDNPAPVAAVTVIQPKQAAQPANMTVTEVNMTKPQLAQAQYQKAQVAEGAQRLKEASSLYLNAIILDPSLHAARKQLVMIYFGQNNTNTAIRLLESGISMFPAYWEFYLMKANIEKSLQEYQDALMTLSFIEDKQPFAKDKWIAQSEIAQQVGQFAIAEKAYRSLLTLESTQPRWWMGLGYALDSQQQYAQAALAYRSALQYPGLSDTAITFIEQRLVQLGESQ